MARIRSVKPAFFRSDSVADLPSHGCRLTLLGLFMYCDDHGRGIDDARLVRAEVWPLDDKYKYTLKMVEADLEAIAKADGMICRYEVDGKRYLHFPKWLDHQKISHPAKSTLPLCVRHEVTEDCGNPPKDAEDPPPHDADPSEDYGGLLVGSGKGKGSGSGSGSGKGSAPADADTSEPAQPDPLPLPATPTPFDRFWDAYPRKLDKGNARKAWNQVLPNKHFAAIQAVMDGLENWDRFWQTTRTGERFIPYAATWLRARRWEDTPSEVSPSLSVVAYDPIADYEAAYVQHPEGA